MKPIKVVDSIMGSGKTSWAIQHMNANKGPFLYVTPYLTEIDRILKACDGFIQPTDEKGTKTDDLKRLLLAGKNIAATHELFKRLDPVAISMIQAGGYSLIMDEVMDVIQPVHLRNEAIQALLRREVLVAMGDADALVRKILPGPETDLDEYAQLRRWAEEDRLVLVKSRRPVNSTLLMWLFPADVFQAFKEVYNLSYLFEGSYQKAYYDMHGLSYEMFSVKGTEIDESWTEYSLVQWVDSQVSPKLAELIDIYDGPMNQIGEADFSLAHTWFGKRKAQPIMQKLGGSIRHYMEKVQRAKSKDIMWTVPQECRCKVTRQGFAKGFVPRTERATNGYAARSVLAYCANVFIKPKIDNFFQDHGVYLDQDLFALSEMVQWIWRSRIRKGEPIAVFIPSRRMRNLFKAWLSGEISNQLKEVA